MVGVREETSGRAVVIGHHASKLKQEHVDGPDEESGNHKEAGSRGEGHLNVRALALVLFEG